MPKKIEDAKHQDIAEFLFENFQEATNVKYGGDIAKLMHQYAALALFFSDQKNFATAAKILSDIMAHYYSQFRETYARGVFSLVLKKIAKDFGFSDTIMILNGQVESAVFAEIVSQRCLFRDIFTRPHGEFTHAIQWLTAGVVYGKDVAHLYEWSVQLKSQCNFKGKFTTGEGEPAYLWNWLVDCFPEAPAEDYEKNLFANTFRCPQYTTQNLTTLTDKSWLGNFIYARSTKGKKNGQQVEEESHYYQKPGKRTVIMPAWEAQRTNWEGKRVYNVHSCDAKGNPVVMEKAYVEMWMHDSYLFNDGQSLKEMEWSN